VIMLVQLPMFYKFTDLTLSKFLQLPLEQACWCELAEVLLP
jgi:hypothetical protein